MNTGVDQIGKPAHQSFLRAPAAGQTAGQNLSIIRWYRHWVLSEVIRISLF
jgi:hypothetical protein